MWQYWLIAAGIFFVGEIFTVGFLIFWLGVASLIAMVVSFFISNLIIQMTVFIISSVILILSTKPFVKKFMEKEILITNAFSLIGKKAIVIQEIDNVKGTGQIKVGGETWSAMCENDKIIPVDAEVKILKIEGVKAIVQQIEVAAKI